MKENDKEEDLTLDLSKINLKEFKSPLNSKDLPPSSPSGSPEISPVTSEKMYRLPDTANKGDLKKWEKKVNTKKATFFEADDNKDVRPTVKADDLPRRRPNRFKMG